RGYEHHKDSFITSLVNPDAGYREIADDLGVTPDLVKSALKEIRDETEALLPKGFHSPYKQDPIWGNVVNPLVPKEARPRLTPSEAQALKDFSIECVVGRGDEEERRAKAPFRLTNKALWAGKTPDPPHDATYKDLQKAFKKTKPFPEPVRVTRGLDFD